MTSIAEDLLLLALYPEKGTTSWRSSSTLPYGLGAALLADLALQERIEFEGKNLAVANATPTGDGLLDEALALVATSKKPHNARHWVSTFTRKVKKLRQRLEARLVQQGILRQEKRKVLFIFPSDRYPEVNAAPEQALRERIRAMVLDGAEVDPRTGVLLSLTKTSNLLDSIFAKDERKAAKKRADEIIKAQQLGNAVSKAAKAAADAAQAAVNAATVAASVATVGSS